MEIKEDQELAYDDKRLSRKLLRTWEIANKLVVKERKHENMKEKINHTSSYGTGGLKHANDVDTLFRRLEWPFQVESRATRFSKTYSTTTPGSSIPMAGCSNSQ